MISAVNQRNSGGEFYPGPMGPGMDPMSNGADQFNGLQMHGQPSVSYSNMPPQRFNNMDRVRFKYDISCNEFFMRLNLWIFLIVLRNFYYNALLLRSV